MTDTMRAAYAFLGSPRSDQPTTPEDGQIALSVRWMTRGVRRPNNPPGARLVRDVVPFIEFLAEREPFALLREDLGRRAGLEGGSGPGVMGAEDNPREAPDVVPPFDPRHGLHLIAQAAQGRRRAEKEWHTPTTPTFPE